MQTRCKNCNYLYFIKYSECSDVYCGLDCKTTYEFKHNITEFIANTIIKQESLNDLIPLSLIMSDFDSNSYIKQPIQSLNINNKNTTNYNRLSL